MRMRHDPAYLLSKMQPIPELEPIVVRARETNIAVEIPDTELTRRLRAEWAEAMK